MSKAILVIDMPESCLNCPMCNSNDECILQDEDANFKASDSWQELITNCPLREVPQKKETSDNAFIEIMNTGYNACIDDILEGSEGNDK